MAAESEVPRTIAEAWARLERIKLEDGLRRGIAPEKTPWSAKLSWCMGARALLEVLKQTDPEKLLPALWRAERELEEMGREATGEMVDDMGMPRILDIIAGRRPGDGDSLDVRPPRRDGR